MCWLWIKPPIPTSGGIIVYGKGLWRLKVVGWREESRKLNSQIDKMPPKKDNVVRKMQDMEEKMEREMRKMQ